MVDPSGQQSAISDRRERVLALARERPLAGGPAAFTLIELLVVISILMLLTVVVVPRLRPATEERALREAARSVNIFITAARNQAVANGRPVGVLIRRHPTEPNAATTLEQVEIPPPYAGESARAALRIQDWTFISGGGYYYANQSTVLKAHIAQNSLTNGLVRQGDLVQLNGQGPIYRIEQDAIGDSNDFLPSLVDGNGFIQFNSAAYTSGWSTHNLTLVAPYGQVLRTPWPPRPATPPGDWSNPVSFSIARQPVDPNTGVTGVFSVMRSAAESLTLPSQTAIDLAFSGRDGQLFGGSGPGAEFREKSATDQTPIIIMFSPTGTLAAVYCCNSAGNYGQQSVTGPVFLLIGKWARLPDLDGNLMPDGGEDGLTNLRDLTNLWVSISPQSGLIITSDVAAQTDTTIDDLVEARQYARQSQTKGGR